MTGAVDHVGLHARLVPHRPAVSDLRSGREFTWETLDRSIGQFAAALVARGVQRGDRVAVLARNCVECVQLHLAAARIGAIYVPFNWRLSPVELSALMRDAEPSLLLGDECLSTFALPGVHLREFALEAAQLESRTPEFIDATAPSLILYTSGTSGKPKGVMLSERNLLSTAINFSLLGRVDRNSVFLVDAPMFHVIGLVTNIRPALMQGGRIMISDGFVAERTLQRIERLGITHYFCVPQMAAAIRAEPGYDPEKLRSLVALFTGGAPHAAPNIRAWLSDGIAIVDGFGMSEAGTVFGMPLERQLIATRAGSVGLAAPGLRSRIVDADGQDVPLGETGELLLKGENIFESYWRRPVDTAEAFTRDGWFRTGDLMRADAGGYHWAVDRRKDMFISGGENIYPAEIEAVLAAHPDVVECAVVGIPDERWGEVGHLFVVAAGSTGMTAEAIVAFLADHLARFKLPKSVSFITALPRNAAGKIRKDLLKQELG